MIIEDSRTLSDIAAVLLHPDIYKTISEDGAPPASEFQIPLDDHIYLVGKVDGVPMGVMIFHQDSAVTWWCHIQVLPGYRKAYADRFADECIDIAKSYGMKKLIAQIPFCYPNVMAFGRAHGFEVEGINNQSYLKNGALRDQWYLGRSLATLEKSILEG